MAADKPTYHYLAIGRMGRGQVVELFLKDAGIDVDSKKYTFPDGWPTTRAKLQEDGITRTGSLPCVQYKGNNLTQHMPILRYLARELGGYDGESNIEKYQVDAVADIYIDWRSNWVTNLLGGVTDEFKTKTVPDYYKVVAQYYADGKGPYLLGDKVTYADFAVYMSIDNNERIGVKVPLPAELAKLQEAFEARPNIGAYLKEDKPQ